LTRLQQRQHTSAYVSERQHKSSVAAAATCAGAAVFSLDITRQHTSAYESIRQIPQHT
jgi:glutamine amidotransferase PdxT